ncbi:MAG: endonuclease/exonuclease/phosphatase family protein [Verrucomicrobiaceae bacterium]
MARVLLLITLLIASLHGDDVRVATYNVYLGIEDPETSEYAAFLSILARIDADVLCLQEVRTGDLDSTLLQLASTLGYPHIFTPTGSDFDNNNNNVILSKFPFASTHSINSPSGAKDLTRTHAAAVIDVPGTQNDPMVICLHLKCCFEPDDFFRRAIDLRRVTNFLDDQGLDGSDNVIILGDFNLLGSPQSYTELPAGLPSTYTLGSDISFPVQYYMNPVSYFTAYPLLNPMPLQQDGIDDATYQSGSILDYILVSQAILDRAPVLEIYNSQLESSFPGLPKSGSALASGTSALASDHYPVFGDFDLESTIPISLTLGTNILAEGSTPTSLTVTLPQAPGPGESVTVLLCSSDPSEAIPSQMTLTFAAGVTSQSTTLIPLPDSISDGTQTLSITASAAGFGGDEKTLSVLDTDLDHYQITALYESVFEDFPGFEGLSTPSEWTASGLTWLGLDDGTSATEGLRSYGPDGTIGIINSEPVSFTGDFHNASGETITALSILYTAEQWRFSFGGSQDRWEVALITPAGTTQIPDLTFTSSNTIHPEEAPNELTEVKNASLHGLNIAPDSDFQLRFTAVPGAPGTGGGNDIFLNELHYDNTGGDSGEFLEIVVGPGFTAPLSEVTVTLYNGGNDSPYGSHTLDTFTLGETTLSGHRIYSKDIPGIQNGDSDAIAIDHLGTLLQFLSYEGTMTATSGPANGMTSTDIGVSQSPSTPVGEESLALTGTGSGPNDFTWTTQPGPFTKGTTNIGQTFGASLQGQGIAFDDLQVIPQAPSNDPSPVILSNSILRFQTLPGFTYLVESSTDLQTWTPFATRQGTGQPTNINLTPLDPARFFRVQVSP